MNELQQEVLRLWSQNQTSMQIAVKLGLTRGAVMGHINRMRQKGLVGFRVENRPTPKPKPEKKKAEATKKVAELSVKIIEVPATLFVPPKGPVKMMQLHPLSCRYIIGDTSGPDTLFCGQKKTHGAYCETHYKLCHEPSREQKKRSVYR